MYVSCSVFEVFTLMALDCAVGVHESCNVDERIRLGKSTVAAYLESTMELCRKIGELSTPIPAREVVATIIAGLHVLQNCGLFFARIPPKC